MANNSVKKDPVSGNKVPPNGTAKGVRDDVPALLSEGEYVIPENVVNTFGVDVFDKLVEQTNSMLKTKPGNVQKMAEGGFVENPTEADIVSTFNPDNYRTVGFSYFGNTTPSSQVSYTFVTYVDANGNTIQIRVDANGNPLDPIPAGYLPQGQAVLTQQREDGDTTQTQEDTFTSYYTYSEEQFKEMLEEPSGIEKAMASLFSGGIFGSLIEQDQIANMEAAAVVANDLGYTDTARGLLTKSQELAEEAGKPRGLGNWLSADAANIVDRHRTATPELLEGLSLTPVEPGKPISLDGRTPPPEAFAATGVPTTTTPVPVTQPGQLPLSVPVAPVPAQTTPGTTISPNDPSFGGVPTTAPVATPTPTPTSTAYYGEPSVDLAQGSLPESMTTERLFPSAVNPSAPAVEAAQARALSIAQGQPTVIDSPPRQSPPPMEGFATEVRPVQRAAPNTTPAPAPMYQPTQQFTAPVVAPLAQPTAPTPTAPVTTPVAPPVVSPPQVTSSAVGLQPMLGIGAIDSPYVAGRGLRNESPVTLPTNDMMTAVPPLSAEITQPQDLLPLERSTQPPQPTPVTTAPTYQSRPGIAPAGIPSSPSSPFVSENATTKGVNIGGVTVLGELGDKGVLVRDNVTNERFMVPPGQTVTIKGSPVSYAQEGINVGGKFYGLGETALAGEATPTTPAEPVISQKNVAPVTKPPEASWVSQTSLPLQEPDKVTRVTVDRYANNNAELVNAAKNAANQYGIPEELFLGMITQESQWNTNATSPVGAFGLTQVMPATAKQPGFGVTPLQNWSVQEQLRFGAEYLNAMYEQYGNWEDALKAYNQGKGTTDSGRLTSEAAKYVPQVFDAADEWASYEEELTRYNPPDYVSFDTTSSQTDYSGLGFGDTIDTGGGDDSKPPSPVATTTDLSGLTFGEITPTPTTTGGTNVAPTEDYDRDDMTPFSKGGLVEKRAAKYSKGGLVKRRNMATRK